MHYDFIQATLMALLLGSVIGLERQWHRRLVDLKTNALVSLGACLFMLVTKTSSGLDDYVRMAGQIVVGVGFIGGGLLFRDNAQIKGINTAATLWCCAAVGILCGIHRIEEATIASLTIVIANSVLRQLAQFLNLKMGASDSLTDEVQFKLTCLHADAASIQHYSTHYFEANRLELKAMQQQPLDTEHTQISYTILFEQGQFSQESKALMQSFKPEKVLSFSWQRA
jgi:putative Mg2+ transporter-C (MgtC) family protein